MALTPLPTNTPLTQLRDQGFGVEFKRAMVIVFPRPKITESVRQFVTDNLLSIVDELNLEDYYRKNENRLGYDLKNDGNTARSQGYLVWDVSTPIREELGAPPIDPVVDVITDKINGYLSI